MILVRLALSLAMAARSSDLPGVVTARLVEELMAGYLESVRRTDHCGATERQRGGALRRSRGDASQVETSAPRTHRPASAISDR